MKIFFVITACFIGLLTYIHDGFAIQPSHDGIVIHHIPKNEKRYIGSPSICILPDGSYLASHDEFGPKSNEPRCGTTRIYKSVDQGKSWKRIATLKGQYMSNLFVLHGDVYIIGTIRTHSNFVIRRSTDGGKTWTIPYSPETGLLLEGEYHSAPVPVIEYKGRIWRALEYATAKTYNWGERYSAMVISAPVNADLLNRDNWTVSNHIGREDARLGDNFQAWLEGNMVVSPSGKLVNILRINTFRRSSEKAAVIEVSKSGKKISFDGTLISLPGAAKKFTIRYDKSTSRYISLVNYDDGSHPELSPFRIRNNVVLISSSDLKTWEIHKLLLYNPDVVNYAFQYIDWVFDGDDIIFVSRTSDDEKAGHACSFHNANYLTFHRLKNYREALSQRLDSINCK